MVSKCNTFILSILCKNVANALIYVNTTSFTLLHPYMFQLSRDHPQEVLIHFMSRVSKIRVQM
jgi:hypothetical protein